MQTASYKPQPDHEFEFTNTDFEALANLVHVSFGLELPPSKKTLAYARLSPRLRMHGFLSFSQYLEYLRSFSGQKEHKNLVSALTTNVTRFFREPHHFDFLERNLGPHLESKLNQGQPVRIWSAGCSSGQEAVSIAITLCECLPEKSLKNVSILATDVDADIIQTAAKNRFEKPDIETMPEPFQAKYFKTLETGETQQVVSKLITYGQLNLVEKWPFSKQFDAIFCRNVAIYFNAKTRSNLWSRFYDALEPGGVLFVGHSERVETCTSKAMQNVGVTTYQKPLRGELN